MFHGKIGSFTFCTRDKFVLTQKLARVPQTTLIELMVCENLLRNKANQTSVKALVRLV